MCTGDYISQCAAAEKSQRSFCGEGDAKCAGSTFLDFRKGYTHTIVSGLIAKFKDILSNTRSCSG